MIVKVYSSPFCFWCNMLKKFLKENNIEFEDLNVQENQEPAIEMVEKTGQTGVPVIDIDGKIIVGFDEKKIRKALSL